jgi:hypothetical protein
MTSSVCWFAMVRGVLVLVAMFVSSVRAAPHDANAWLALLTNRVVDDLIAGRPLVVQAHVPLCDNSILSCGNRKLGDGESPSENLYWATTEGFVGWFGRRGSGWHQVLHDQGEVAGDRDVIEVRIWKRTIDTPRAWIKRGAPRKLSVYVVAYAWRGIAIDRALAAYWHDLYGVGHHNIALADGTTLVVGGGAQLVGYTGHNRLYDVDAPTWASLERVGAPIRGTIAIACNTGPFMANHVAAPHRVPLVFTRDFLMASAGAFEGAVMAFARGGDYRAIRSGAAHGYADAGNQDVARISYVFTNPSDPRWGVWK